MKSYTIPLEHAMNRGAPFALAFRAKDLATPFADGEWRLQLRSGRGPTDAVTLAPNTDERAGSPPIITFTAAREDTAAVTANMLVGDVELDGVPQARFRVLVTGDYTDPGDEGEDLPEPTFTALLFDVEFAAPGAAMIDVEFVGVALGDGSGSDEDVDAAIAAALAAHVAASDPHTGYQKESEKNAANGYAGLDGNGLIPDARLPSGITRDTELTSAIDAAIVAEQTARNAAIGDAIAGVINGAPDAFNTLKELYDQLATDESGVAALITSVAGKQPLATLLTNLVAAAPGANQYVYFTAANTPALGTISSFFRTLTSSSDAAALKQLLALENVTNTADANKPVSTAQQTAIDAKVADAINDGTTAVAPSQNAVFDALALKLATSVLDTDTTLAANSDAKIATQKATKAYVDTAVTGLLDFKGSTNASANPNYPAASKGDAYVVSTAGKIGGGSGKSVDIGDIYLATADNAGGTEASVGTSWTVLEHNLVGAVLTSDIGSTVQAYSAVLANLAAQVDLAVADGGTGASNAAAAAANLAVTPITGWIEDSATWTRTGNTTFTVAGDQTARFYFGVKVRWKESGGSYKYGVVASSSFSSVTTVTLIGTTDYTMGASPDAGSTAYSIAASPQGFPHTFAYTPTITGYSANPTNAVYTWQVRGNCILITIREGTFGTSNATTKTYTPPSGVTAKTRTNAVWLAKAGVTDGGTAKDGAAYIASAGTVINVHTSFALAAWANSGNASVGTLQLEFEVA